MYPRKRAVHNSLALSNERKKFYITDKPMEDAAMTELTF